MEAPSDPTPAEAAAVLHDIETARQSVAAGIRLPPAFHNSIGAAVAAQIFATAFGVAVDGALWVIFLGFGVFGVVAGVQVWALRRLNSVRVNSLVSHVVLGSSDLISALYAAVVVAAAWAALGNLWWVAVAASLVGGVGYALAGRYWMQAYRKDPARLSRSQPFWVLALTLLAAVVGLIALVVGH